MTEWWVGCSGFHYKHWKEIFYPKGLPATKWFEYYCQHYKTLELNVTFYRFPKLEFLKRWYDVSPGHFLFSVKAPRIITHFKQFIGTKDLITEFYDTILKGLNDKLGCVLFQLPPRIAFSEERLERIVDSLDPSFSNVLEFRHITWWNPLVYERLTNHNITFCGMSHPNYPEDAIANTEVVYYRFHGKPRLYDSKYNITTLQRVADEITTAKKIRKVFLYFNNDIGGSAIINAKQMQELLEVPA
jgi:uncharacterized protein YecE (DUF72 family)